MKYLRISDTINSRDAELYKFGSVPAPAPGNHPGSGSGQNVPASVPYIRNMTNTYMEEHENPLDTQ